MASEDMDQNKDFIFIRCLVSVFLAVTEDKHDTGNQSLAETLFNFSTYCLYYSHWTAYFTLSSGH